MNGLVSRPRHGLSLCAGGGGLDLGLMLAGPGFHTRAFVEWESWPRSVLIAAQRAGYFAPAPIWDDLRSFDARPFRGAFDIVLAGYPCQPFSAAGKRGGADDPRHLWPDVARVIAECRPQWVFLENVPGHVTLGLETVLRELWGLGYTPAAGLFSAAEVGAPHQRLRIFILAHTDEPASRHRSLQPSGQQRLHPQGRSAGAGHHQLVDAEGIRWREGWTRTELWLGWGRHFLRELTKKIPFGEFNNPTATVERANEFCAHASARRPINAFTGIEVAYGARHEDNNGYEFRLFLLSCGGQEGDAWSVCRVGEDELASTQSVHVYSGGLGGKEFQKRQKWIVGGDQGQVARASFWTLCDLVDGVPRNDLMTGGFPQLAKIDSTGSASPIGVVYRGVPTVFGSRVSDTGGRAEVWVDENFTQVHPISLKKYSRAQRYARPKHGR